MADISIIEDFDVDVSDADESNNACFLSEELVPLDWSIVAKSFGTIVDNRFQIAFFGRNRLEYAGIGNRSQS